MKTLSSSSVIAFSSRPCANGDLLSIVSTRPSGPLLDLELLTSVSVGLSGPVSDLKRLTPPSVVAFEP
jgi:hypothetical protein